MRVAPIALLLVLVFPTAAAATERWYIEMRDDGFRVPGEAGVNPTLRVEPGTHVVLRARNNGTAAQNIHFGAPLDVATPFAQRPGEQADLSFDAPADFTGDVTYVSDADPGALHGILHIGVVPPTIKIKTPAEGAQVSGDALTVDVTTTRWTGIIAYLLDAKAVGTTHATTFTYRNLAPGPHIARAQLVLADGTPLDPPVYDERLVTLKATPTPVTQEVPSPSPSPAPSRGIPSVGVPLALAPVLALAFVTASRCRHRR